MADAPVMRACRIVESRVPKWEEKNENTGREKMIDDQSRKQQRAK
jgi:hypothetical protein